MILVSALSQTKREQRERELDNRAADLIVIADQDYFDTSHHSGSRDYLDTGSAGFYPV